MRLPPVKAIKAAMNKHPPKPDHNVVQIPAKALKGRKPASDFVAPALGTPGNPHDSRTREALRLIEAFLAIEDTAARSALVALAERLVSYDWVRKVQQR
jgi:hypothetical protein